VHEQLLRLLSTAEKARLVSTDSLPKTFNKIGALYYNPYTEPAWRTAVTSYQKTMEPAEDTVAAKLRAKLRDASGKVGLFCHSFLYYGIFFRQINEKLHPDSKIRATTVGSNTVRLQSDMRQVDLSY